MSDRWQEEMQARGLVDKNGWFKHRLWRVPPVSIRTSHSDPLPVPDLLPKPTPATEGVILAAGWKPAAATSEGEARDE